MQSYVLMVLVCVMVLVGCATHNNSSQPTWTTETMQAVGTGSAENTGNPAQTKFMAERASEIIALNQLVQKIRNLPVDDTTVGNLLPADWKLSNFKIDSIQHQPDGSCQTMVSIPLSHIWNQVQMYRK